MKIDKKTRVTPIRTLSLLAVTGTLIVLTSCRESTTKTSTTPTPSSSAATMPHENHGGGKKININTAILSELDKLEAKLGVPALSNKIQASRPYAKIEELVTKKVITQEQLSQIKDIVTIEEVVLTGEAKDVDYMTKLGLMKGHLIVAQELLDQGKPQEAEPHIGHPVEEIYTDVEDQLKERNVKEFKTTLVNLQDLVKAGAKDPKQVKALFQNAMQSIDSAIQSISETQRKKPKFVIQVINGLLDTASSEYGASIAGGKIAAAIEYQDSRGFVTYADTLYQGISDTLGKEQPETNKAIAAGLTELKTVWPSVIPPATPVKTPKEVSQLIKTLEQDTKKVIGNR
jgi:DNA uptake protein ComE-like DNA-binding protein